MSEKWTYLLTVMAISGVVAGLFVVLLKFAEVG